MTVDANLFWFGSILEVVLVMIILKWLGFDSKANIEAGYRQSLQESRTLQQEWQRQSHQLIQECARLRQELQEQTARVQQLAQERLQLQETLQHQETALSASLLAEQTQKLQQQEALFTQQLQEQLQQQEAVFNQRLQDLLAEQTQKLQQQEALFAQQLQEQLQQQSIQLEATESSLANQPLTAELKQECQNLREQLEIQQQTLTRELHQATFRHLQSLLINYPSVARVVQAKPELPAKNVTPMFVPLDNLLQNWGYSTIGNPWEQVPYDPQLHQADASDVQPGEPVYIRFVGYRDGEDILCPAKVSRTLPGGSKG